MPIKDRIIITILTACGLLCAAGMLRAEDPAQIRRDAKEAAKVQKLIAHELQDQANIVLILNKYAVSHNCLSGQANLNQMAQIGCVAPPPAPPKPEPPKEEK